MDTEKKRIEKEVDVRTYIAQLKYALSNGAKISFQEVRMVDEQRDIKNTNKYTMSTLFPDEDPLEVLKRELMELTVEDYICSVKDIRYPKRSEMRVFGKTYNSIDEVYIKIRVELLDPSGMGGHTAFVMSFHFAEKPFSKEEFPYRKKSDV